MIKKSIMKYDEAPMDSALRKLGHVWLSTNSRFCCDSTFHQLLLLLYRIADVILFPNIHSSKSIQTSQLISNHTYSLYSNFNLNNHHSTIKLQRKQ